jgi:hypothetical protein
VIKSRKLHKIVGLVLVLPMLGWTITGIIFFIKPGYQGAYEQLAVKTYPLNESIAVQPKSDWQEVRLVTTILGDHLLVKSNNKTEHLDPDSLLPKPAPSEIEFKALLSDAFTSNSARYGEVIKLDGLSAQTNTGVEIKLDWNNLRLSQKGQDTQLINLLYKVHYLQWTSHKGLDQLLGVLGLILLILLTILGVRLYVKK